MDYNHPYRRPGIWRKQYCIALIAVGGAGFLWVFAMTVSFLRIRMLATSSPAVVVGYEFAGGKERLRVKALQDGKPRGFMVLDAAHAWPRYAEGQPVELLSRNVTNRLGQKVAVTIPYAPRNHWQTHAVVGAASLLAVAVGAIGLSALCVAPR